MSDTFQSDAWPPEDRDDLLAAEYVLGVLPAPERQAVAKRAELEGALQERIAAWENRLALLNAAYEDGPVSPEVFYVPGTDWWLAFSDAPQGLRLHVHGMYHQASGPRLAAE